MKATNLMRTAGAGASAALVTYLFDPDRGRARRARLADQGRALARALLTKARARAEYQKGVARGVFHEVTKPLREERQIDDATLLQKVRSEALGRWEGRVDAVEVDIDQGTVVLRGSVPSQEAARLVEMISAVEGVEMVVDELH